MNKPFMTIGECKIFGNNHNVPLVYWHELTENEQKDFDWMDNPDDNFLGFRYKGNVYCMSEIMRVEPYNPFWPTFEGYASDTFFSGILVKYVDSDFVKVYTYYS